MNTRRKQRKQMKEKITKLKSGGGSTVWASKSPASFCQALSPCRSLLRSCSFPSGSVHHTDPTGGHRKIEPSVIYISSTLLFLWIQSTTFGFRPYGLLSSQNHLAVPPPPHFPPLRLLTLATPWGTIVDSCTLFSHPPPFLSHSIRASKLPASAPNASLRLVQCAVWLPVSVCLYVCLTICLSSCVRLSVSVPHPLSTHFQGFRGNLVVPLFLFYFTFCQMPSIICYPPLLLCKILVFFSKAILAIVNVNFASPVFPTFYIFSLSLSRRSLTRSHPT